MGMAYGKGLVLSLLDFYPQICRHINYYNTDSHIGICKNTD